MQLINTALLSDVCAQAAASPRLRMNYNFHDRLDAPAQRLINALQPGTELPVHCHRHTAETYLLLQGSLRVMFYDDNKNVVEETVLNRENGVMGVHIPAGQWHTLEVLEPDTAIFEVKDGPYTPLQAEDML
ncbi:MAG: WbuC family cupin fold metalloprotein [Alloprevotella sp.]|nr:WbuC family cupin fold metalloprotein [Alloprevotella sp.]